jgi:hypothetical protein
VTVNTGQLAAWLRPEGPSADDLPCAQAEWEHFTAAACDAGLAGLILESARTHPVRLPTDADAALTHRATGTAAHNLSASAELERLLKAFNREGLAVALLKGAALNLCAYDRPDLRPMSDVDLLIAPEDANAVRCLLQREGCRRGFDLLRDDFFPRYHYEVEYLTDTPFSLRIDLHARPLRPLRVSRTLPDDAFQSRAQRVPVGQAWAFVPAPEVMLIHLAAHAAFHGCSRLLWLYDIHRFARASGEPIDWGLLVELAGRWRLSLAVVNGLEQTAKMLGPVAPTDVLEALRAGRITWRDRLALRAAPHDAWSPIAHVAVNLLCTPGIRFKLGYLAALLLPGRSHLADIYPYRHAGWVLCAHGWRVVRSLGRLVATPFRLLSSSIRRCGMPKPEVPVRS